MTEQASGAGAQGTVVQIADYSGDKPKLYDERLEEIITRSGISNLPTILICIGGMARQGKSFLLSMMVSLLTYYEQRGNHDRWELSDFPVNQLRWAQSRKAVTLGMGIWDHPFIITKPDGRKVAVLLVDSQGTQDNQRSDPKADTLITFISLRISSAYLLNMKADIRSDDIFGLQLVADYADVGSFQSQQDEGADTSLFKASLFFVLRDYQHGDANYGEDPGDFDRMVADIENDELRQVYYGAKRAFPTISTYKLPRPDKMATATADQHKWKARDIPMNFTHCVKEMVDKLCGLTNPDIPKDCWGSAEELLAHYKSMKEDMERSDKPEIGSPADALRELIVQKGFLRAEDVIKAENTEIRLTLGTIKDMQALKQRFDGVRSKAMEAYKQTGLYSKYGQTDTWSKYQAMLNNSLENDEKVLQVELSYQQTHARLLDEQQKMQAKNQRNMEERNREIIKLTGEKQALQRELANAQRQREERNRKAQEEIKGLQSQLGNANKQQRVRLKGELQKAMGDHQAEKDASIATQVQNQAELNRLKKQIEQMEKEQEKQGDSNKKDLDALKGKIKQAQDDHQKKLLEIQRNSKLSTLSKIVRGVAQVVGSTAAGAIMGAAGGGLGAGVGAAVGFVTGVAGAIISAVKD